MSISNSCTSFINKYSPVFEPAFAYIDQKKISIACGISGAILGNIIATTALFLSENEYGLAGNLIVNLTGAGGGGAIFALAGKVIEGYQEAKKMNFQFPLETQSNEDSSGKNLDEDVNDIDLRSLDLNKA